MTNFTIERDAILQRWYGLNRAASGRRPAGPIKQSDYLGIQIPVNLPFQVWGYCLVWKYSLNQTGHGMLTGGHDQLAHRQAFIQAHGAIPEGMQINHLCNRPYCVQPAHLYAGDPQDNTDDRRIFNDPEYYYRIMAWHMHPDAKFDDDLMKRVRESDRLEMAEPWDPPEQAPQEPLMEFTCPGHDFQIPMQGNGEKICRICEASSSEGNFYGDSEPFLLAQKICPGFQCIEPIFEKLVQSEFLTEQHSKFREKASTRSIRISGPLHDIRTCECRFCQQDRATFRQILEPHLTGLESNILDACDDFLPKAKQILLEGTKDTMEVWVREAEPSQEQITTIRDHCGECHNSRTKESAQMLEIILGCILHAMTAYKTRDEIREAGAFNMLPNPERMFQGPFRMTEWDSEQANRIKDTIYRTGDRMIEAAEEAAKILVENTYGEENPEIHQQIWGIASMLFRAQVMEHLRYEFTGRNSRSQQQPPPHFYCVQNILRTGTLNPFEEFPGEIKRVHVEGTIKGGVQGEQKFNDG